MGRGFVFLWLEAICDESWLEKSLGMPNLLSWPADGTRRSIGSPRPQHSKDQLDLGRVQS